MIWFILGFIIFVGILIGIIRSKWFNLTDKIFGCVMSFMFSMLCILFVLLTASGIVSCFAQIDYVMVSDTKIIALKDNQNVAGYYYIFSGYANEDLYYYYATETELGRKTEKVSADNSYIKYTDGKTHIEKYEPKFENDIFYWFAFPMNDYRYIIYCPENTITAEFNIDLE